MPWESRDRCKSDLVTLIGTGGACRFLGARLQRRLDPGDLRTAAALRPILIILGDLAFQLLSAEEFFSWLGPDPCPVVAWRQAISLITLTPWIQMGAIAAENADIERIVLGLLAQARPGVRRSLPIAIWCPEGARTPEGWEVLQAIESLRCVHDVGELWGQLRWTRSKLWRVCNDEWGCPAREMMQRFARMHFEDGRRRGVPAADIAASLGYESAVAIRRIARSLPPPRIVRDRDPRRR